MWKSLWSGLTHAGSQGVLPEIIVGKGLFRQSGACLVGDNHVLYKGCPAHVGVPKRLGHEPLVRFYRFLIVTHVSACPDYQFSKVPSVGHHKHIRLQADQEVEGCQACHVLPETHQLLLSCQLLFGNLS